MSDEPSYPMRDPKDLEWQKKYIRQQWESLKTTEGQLKEAQYWLQRKKIFYMMYENRPSHPTAIEVRKEIAYYENEINNLKARLNRVVPPPPAPAAQIHPPDEIHPDDAFQINMNG